MALGPWKNLSKEMTRLQREMNTLFDNIFKEEGETVGKSDWLPPIDMAETDTGFVVTVEVPDINPSDIDISVLDQRVTIKGEKKKEEVTDSAQFHKTERSYGSFVRQLTVPIEIDGENISAEYDKGVLRLTLPKLEQKKAKSVKVKVKKEK